MFRHDAQRSGATEASVGAELTVAWQSTIETSPSALAVSGGRVFVSGVNTHTVHALDAADGHSVWATTVGARVESPPSIHEDLAIFGSNDGHVYAVRAADGVLAWRFQAAPQESRVTVHDQLESPWPVPGVLVQNGQCWFAAGRSSYLDGGIQVLAVDPTTGRIVHEQTIYSPDPQTGRMAATSDPQQILGLLNDIPAGDGQSVFIRQLPIFSSGTASGQRIYSTAGYLDPSWFNRTYWKFGPTQTSGLMVLGRDAVYGMELYESRSRETVFRPGASAYRLVCLPLTSPLRETDAEKAKRPRAKPVEPKPTWELRLPIRVTALVRAGDTIFAAGSPDKVDPVDPHGAWEGRQGGVLAAFAAADGRQLSELRLPSPPVWDGLAAVDGRLYIALRNGQVMCLIGK